MQNTVKAQRKFDVRRYTGELTIATGTLHTLVGLAYYADEVSGFFRDGILASVTEGTSGEIAFWFLLMGAFLILSGVMARSYQRQTGTLPMSFGWIMLVVSAIGAVMMPASGFWLGIGLGVLGISVARQTREQS